MSLPFKKCDIPCLSSAEYLAFYDKEWTALKSKEIISKVCKKNSRKPDGIQSTILIYNVKFSTATPLDGG